MWKYKCPSHLNDFGQIRLELGVGFQVAEAYFSTPAGGLRDKANNENRAENIEKRG